MSPGICTIPFNEKPSRWSNRTFEERASAMFAQPKLGEVAGRYRGEPESESRKVAGKQPFEKQLLFEKNYSSGQFLERCCYVIFLLGKTNADGYLFGSYLTERLGDLTDKANNG